MTDSVSITMVDNSNERTSFGVSIEPVTAVNVAAIKAAVDVLSGFLDDTGLLPITSDNISIKNKFDVNAPTDVVGANREMGVRYHMLDTAGNKTFVTQGGADFTLFPFALRGSDFLEPNDPDLHADVTSLISWLETWAKHPITGFTLTVKKLEKVGRNI